MNFDRLSREEAAKYIGCGMSKLYELEKTGLLDGTFYNIGRRRLYITEKLRQWMMNGGEYSAFERAANVIPIQRESKAN